MNAPGREAYGAHENRGVNSMNDIDKREAAITRLKAKRDFVTHLMAYLVVNGFLIVIWAMTEGNNGGHFWPAWVLAGWGIGLVLHAWETWRPPISEQAINREMERL